MGWNPGGFSTRCPRDEDIEWQVNQDDTNQYDRYHEDQRLCEEDAAVVYPPGTDTLGAGHISTC